MLLFFTIAFTVAFCCFSNATDNSKLSSSPSTIDWSEFEDILQLPTPDLSPVRHDSSLHSTTQTGSQSTTIKKQNLRSKEVGKAAYAKEKSRMEKDPEFAEKRRKQKKESSRKHQLKIRSTLTEEQRRINKLRQNQRYRKHYHIQKAHYGGAYGSAKSREIYALREKEKAGLASLEDLEKLKQAREKANEAVRKSRSKKSKSTQSQ